MFEESAKSEHSGKNRVLPSRLRTVAQVNALASRRDPAATPLFIEALGHRRQEVRASARRALHDLGEPAFQALLEILQWGNRRQREMAADALGDWGDRRAVLPLLNAIQRAEQDSRKPTTLGCIAMLFFGWIGFALWLMARCGMVSLRDTTTLRGNAAGALGRMGDVRAVSKLAQMARSRERGGGMTYQAIAALMDVLPNVQGMTPAQADSLGEEAIPRLCALLSHRNSTLVQHILFALRFVGDGRAIPAAERLARTTRDEGLVHELNTLLPILRERVAQEQARTTLLRGSSAESRADLPMELLRPAQDVVATPPEQMLRAAHAPPDQEA